MPAIIQDSDQVQRAWARGWNISPRMSTYVVVHVKIRHIFIRIVLHPSSTSVNERAVQQLCNTRQQFMHWQKSAKAQHRASTCMILVKHIIVRLTVVRASQLHVHDLIR